MISEMAQLVPLILFSAMAMWRPNAVLFLISGGLSMMVGLSWYDTFGTNVGLSVSLMMIAFSLYCFAMAFRMLFWHGGSDE